MTEGQAPARDAGLAASEGFCQKLLIVGASGYLARNLAQRLKELRPRCPLSGVGRNPCAEFEAFSLCDLNDRHDIAKMLAEQQPDIIFHMAAKVHDGNWDDYYSGNVHLTTNLLEAVADVRPSARVVIPGSAAEYGQVPAERLPIVESEPFRPISPYGVSKAWQFQAALYFSQVRGLDIVVGRIFNLIGPGMAPYLSIGSFERQLREIRAKLRRPVVLAGNVAARRDFIDVADACKGLLAVAESGNRGESYNICTGQSRSIGEVLDAMIAASSVAITRQPDLDCMGKPDISESRGSFAKLEAVSGWRPQVPFEESVRRIVRQWDHA